MPDRSEATDSPFRRHLQLDVSTIFFAMTYSPFLSGLRGADGLGEPSRDSNLRASTFSTWLYSSSTGVARPKIDTATLSRDFSSSTILDEAVERGERAVADPHLLADSKVTDGFGRSIPSWTWRMIREASASLIGEGRPRPPRNPVTSPCSSRDASLVAQIHLDQDIA